MPKNICLSGLTKALPLFLYDTTFLGKKHIKEECVIISNAYQFTVELRI
ncbi:hypothetical protein QE429_001748 [Bacillus sp. SORGH_AS 510]|nr:hypothetical protein [Bacillus sp. SORGH_AS_0510]MDQ1144921.1 hypothetical protein [Bacillus sp. SORGH_AS_0510]